MMEGAIWCECLPLLSRDASLVAASLVSGAVVQLQTRIYAACTYTSLQQSRFVDLSRRA